MLKIGITICDTTEPIYLLIINIILFYVSFHDNKYESSKRILYTFFLIRSSMEFNIKLLKRILVQIWHWPIPQCEYKAQNSL